MTGEVTLRGRVLPIGGLKEKLLAALRGGITKVLIPEENVKDLAEIPDNVKAGLDIVPVSHVDQVLAHALVELPRPSNGARRMIWPASRQWHPGTIRQDRQARARTEPAGDHARGRCPETLHCGTRCCVAATRGKWLSINPRFRGSWTGRGGANCPKLRV